MKTHNAKKLIKTLEKILNEGNEEPLWVLYETIPEEFLPWELNDLDNNTLYPCFDSALCRLNRKNLTTPGNPLEEAILKMLLRYVKKHNKNGWVDWAPLMRHVK